MDSPRLILHIASRSKRTMQMAQLQASLPVAHVVQCHAINLLESSSEVAQAGLQIRNANSHDCEKLRSEANSYRFASHKIDSTSLRNF